MPDPYVHVDVATFDRLTEQQVVPLDDATDHHLRRVLRLAAGDGLVLSDGAGRRADGVLTEAGVRTVAAPVEVDRPQPRIHLVQALTKGRGVDEVVRALTELGIQAVTIVTAARSVAELRGDKRAKAHERWVRVARSAAAQARRAHLPEVVGPVDVKRAAAGVAGPVVGLVPHVGADSGLSRALNAHRGRLEEVRLAIGPEGGWTDAELATFRASGWRSVTLGSSVLRTEHAGLAAAAATAALVGWMD